MKRFFTLLLLAIFVTGIQAQQKVTLRDIAQGTYRAQGISGLKPMLDGEHYTQISSDHKRIVKYSFKTGEEVGTLFDVTTARDCDLKSFDDYILSPVFQAVVCLFFGGGLFLHSGLGDACHRMVSGTRKFSRKEKRGMGLAAVTFLVYVGLCVLLAFGPWNTVRSAIGTLSDSPLADGFWGVCSLGVALPSIVYGFASDSYLDDSDVVEGMAYLYKSRATYFVVLLFITLFFSSLEFSGLTDYAGLPDEVCRGAYLLCCVLFLL